MPETDDYWDDNIDDLVRDDIASLKLNQEVTVVSGKYAGRKGKVHFVRTEGDHQRLTLIDGDEYFYVNSDEIDHKYEAVEVALFMPDDERASWFARIREIEENWENGGE